MEFDKSKILTVVTAYQVKVGMKGWFSNHPNLLKSYMERQTPDTLKDLDMDRDSPFYDGYNYFNLFYPAPEPTYRPFKNAEEFKPYREKWLRYKNNIDAPAYGAFKPFRYSDDDIQLLKLLTWEQAFNDVIFEDGTPFGIKVQA